MAKKIKSNEDNEQYNEYNSYPDYTIKGNEKALTKAHEDLRDKFNKEYYINNDENKARKIESDYNSKVIHPMDEDLIKQKKDYELRKNAKFSSLKKLIRGK